MSDAAIYLRAVLALLLVLGLIVLTAYLLRRFGGGGAGLAGRLGQARGKRRLAIVEVTAIDARRRLILARRDATEHLILVGGPNDLLIESGIAAPALAEAPLSAARERAP